MFQPAANFNGAAGLQVTTDDQGSTGAGGPRSDTDTVAITVLPVNDAPVLAAIGSKSVAEGALLTFSAVAIDPEGDALTFTLAPGAGDRAAGAAMDPATGRFTWRPTEE